MSGKWHHARGLAGSSFVSVNDVWIWHKSHSEVWMLCYESHVDLKSAPASWNDSLTASAKCGSFPIYSCSSPCTVSKVSLYRRFLSSLSHCIETWRFPSSRSIALHCIGLYRSLKVMAPALYRSLKVSNLLSPIFLKLKSTTSDLFAWCGFFLPDSSRSPVQMVKLIQVTWQNQCWA